MRFLLKLPGRLKPLHAGLCLFYFMLLMLTVPAKATTGMPKCRQIAAGVTQTVALMEDGSVWQWGGVGAASVEPVQVAGFPGEVTALAAGYYHGVALMADRTVMAWGSNWAGQLGNGTQEGSSSVPVRVPGVSDVLAIATRGNMTLAVTSQGRVFRWGTLDSAAILLPEEMQFENAIGISTGLDHAAIISRDGSIWTWGRNDGGKLGDGSNIASTTPVAVQGLLGAAVAVSAGPYHNLALMSDNTVKSWGSNFLGALGDGTDLDRSTAVAVNGLAGVAIREVAAGKGHSVALAEDGRVFTWGYNDGGQLGDGTRTDRLLPAQVTGLPLPAKSVAAGDHFTVALLTDGSVYSWGQNGLGESGYGTTVPVPVPGTQGSPDTVAPTVAATPAAGTYNAAQSVSLSANEPATIYYTTDGSTPTTASARFSTPIEVAVGVTLKYFAVDIAGNVGAVVTSAYLVDATAPAVFAYPSGARYPAPVSVTLRSNEAGSIRYTTDGSEPTVASTQYTAPIVIGATATLKFISFDAAGNASAVVTQSYIISPEAASYVDFSGGTYETFQVRTETADVTVRRGGSVKFFISGALAGDFKDYIDEMVFITSGTYAGWMYYKGTYALNGYTGNVYMLYNPADGVTRGIMTGGVQGVRVQAGKSGKLYLTSLNGEPKSGTVDLTYREEFVGFAESRPGTQLTISTNSNTVNGGAGAVHNTATRIKVNGMAGAFTMGHYQSPLGEGDFYQYSTDPGTTPGLIRNFGMADGPLIGTRELDIPAPVSAGSPLYVRAEKVLGERVPPASPGYITNSIQTINSLDPSVTEMVDVSVEQGAQLTLAASGALTGDFVETASRWVTFQSGSYRGWWYRKGTYRIGDYTGTSYMIGNGTKGWGMLTGDLHGTRYWDGETRRIQITSIRGAKTQALVTLGSPLKVPGQVQFVTGAKLYVTLSASEGESAGYYDGGFSVAAKTLRLEGYPEMMQMNRYEGTTGSGNVYLYSDLQDIPQPGMRGSYGMGDGPMFGARQVVFPYPNGGLWSSRFVRIEHVLDATPPVVTATPPGGNYDQPQTVTLAANEPSTIFYALDGFSDYRVYSAPLSISGTQHLKSYAVDALGNRSEVQFNTYTTATPVVDVAITPAGGWFAAPQSVTLSASDGAAIYYSVNEGDFVPYTGAIAVNGYSGIRYYAVSATGVQGPIHDASYYVQVRPQLSAVNATLTSVGPTRTEIADLLEQRDGTTSYLADGLLQGQLVERVYRLVTIRTGSYAGWSYRTGGFQLGEDGGEMETLQYGDKEWGVLLGSIKGVMIRSGDVTTLYVTSIHGENISGVVTLTRTGSTPFVSSYEHTGVTLTITPTSQSGLATGAYRDTVEMQGVHVACREMGEGFVVGSYQSARGSGSVYLYAFNQGTEYFKRKGAMTGGLLGTWDAMLDLPAVPGSHNHVFMEQYSGNRTRSSSTLVTEYSGRRVVEINADRKESVIGDQGALGLVRPVDAKRVGGDRTLITDMEGNRVIEVDAYGQIVWKYGNLNSPRWAERLYNGNTLIADALNHRVIEVTPVGSIVWQYGTGAAGAGPGELREPTAAYRLTDGSTMIVDCMNHRVILVRSADYRRGEANLGWTAESLVWQYGVSGAPGAAAGQLNTPRRAQLLESGNILISDSSNNRVLEVARDKRIIWSYGTGSAGNGENQLNSPRSVHRLINGDTIVSDFGNNRVVEVSPQGSIVWEQPAATPTCAFDVPPLAAVSDRTAPAGVLTINGGAVTTASPSVSLTSTVGDNSGSVAAMRFSNDNATWYGWQPFSSNRSWSLTPAVGEQTVYAQYKDLSGNVLTLSATIVLTAVTPQEDTVATGETVIAKPSETTSLSFSGITVPGTVSVTPVVPQSEPANFQVLGGASYEITTTAVHEGAIEVCIGYGDAGLIDTYKEADIRLFHMEDGVWVDRTTRVDTLSKQVCGVTGSLSPFVLAMQADPSSLAFTSTIYSGVPLPAAPIPISGEITGAAAAGVRMVEVSTNNGFTWQPAADTSGGSWASWSYTWSPQASGTFVMQARATDISGAVVALSDQVTVLIDAVAPSVAASPAAGNYNAAQLVSLVANEPCTIHYTLDGTLPTTSSSVYHGALLVSSSTTVRFFARDAAGNQSGVQSAAYVISGLPTGSILISGGLGSTSSTSVMLDLFATGNGSAVTQMRFSNDGTNWGTWVPYAATATWELTAGTGSKTVYVQYMDAAGMVSPAPYPFDTIEVMTESTAVPTSKVPVMNGWWLLPGVLSGLLLMYRRRD